MSTLDFQIYQPDANALLRAISRHVDDGMLEEIAAADHGICADAFLRELRPIRDRQFFTIPMDWRPRDVLELIRWSEPDDPRERSGRKGVRGHWMRAFACTALLRAGGEIEEFNSRMGWNSTVIQLIDSLTALRSRFDEPAAQLFAWLIPRFAEDPEEDEIAFLGVGLLWFALRRSTPDEAIVALCRWIVEREGREEDVYGRLPPHWLLDKTYFDSRRSAWERLGGTLGKLDMSDRSPAARDSVALIAAELSGK